MVELPSPTVPPRAPSLAEKVALLHQPATYPEGAQHIECVETHMSYVFLTERHAYKLKKPVRYAYLDFSTLAAREANCREELRLNRRLAANVYLGVVALTRGADGQARLDGGGEVIEWLVKMRRLAAADMLDRHIGRGTLTAAQLASLGAVLGEFYRRAATIALTPAHYRERIAAQVHDHCTALAEPDLALPAAQIARLRTDLEGLLQHAPQLLEERAAGGRIVEGHGDLRPEHVCLTVPPVIFDCLEFNRDFRIVDPVDELAFLAMECERLGNTGVGPALLATYAQVTGDRPPPALVHFYQALRACLRAKLSIWHTHDLPPGAWGKWQELARAYLAIAQRRVTAARSAL